MDGKGRWIDNIAIERFWRKVKYEGVYLKTYEDVKEAKRSLEKYIKWYNYERRRSGINNYRLYEVMKEGKIIEKDTFFGGMKCVDKAYALTHKIQPTTIEMTK